MTPDRTLIRRKVADILKAPVEIEGTQVWATPAQERVYPSRTLGVEVRALPALLVFDDKEEVDNPNATYPRRTLTLQVEARDASRDPQELDESLDRLGRAVELALEADPRLSGLVIGTDYVAMKKDRAAEGSQHFGSLTLTFLVEYVATPEDPDLPDFLRFHGAYAGYPGAEDRVNLPPTEE